MSTTESRAGAAAKVRTPVFASIAARVLELAVAGGLDAGDRLPAERELARRLGVSRTSLREALTALRIEGVIEVQHGNGIYLLHPPAQRIPPIAIEVTRANPGLPALGEVRNTLEAQAAELAALRREDADLAAMIEAIRTMETAVQSGATGVDGDRRFHSAILDAANNPVLSDLLGSLAEGAAQIAAASLARMGQPARSLAAHRLILDAIILRDAEQARRLMREHLELTGQMLADRVSIVGDEAPDAVGLVLGAGAATRFGSPKQLAPFRGEIMINRPVRALREGGLGWVLAVLGAQHERIAARLQGAEPVLAPDWSEGMSASLRAGVAAATRLGAARVIIVLADQPLLSGAAVARVLAASRAGYPIVRADYGEIQGHPTALAAETFAAVAELRGDAGARKLTGFALTDVPCAGLGSPEDADTPEALRRLAGEAGEVQSSG